jgi:transcription-repair coupling factor (superfamily II helicase)
VEELFDSIRLRRLGQRIGFEKIVLKQERLLCYFTSDQDSPYFQSDRFQKVLLFLKSAPQAQLKERNGKLYLSFQEVLRVHDAFQVLKPILDS